MAFNTINDFTPTNTNADGLYPITGVVYGTTWDALFKDLLQNYRYSHVAGVLSGGVCTVSSLTVTIPANTIYVAGGMVWRNDSAETKTVTDDATTYVWGCADGEIRNSASTTQPTGFEGSLSCLLTKSVAVSGTATLDNSVQERARTADHTNRVIGENTKVFAPVVDTLPSGFRGIIPSGSQINIFGSFTNAGTLVIAGKLRVQGE